MSWLSILVNIDLSRFPCFRPTRWPEHPLSEVADAKNRYYTLLRSATSGHSLMEKRRLINDMREQMLLPRSACPISNIHTHYISKVPIQVNACRSRRWVQSLNTKHSYNPSLPE